jgi:hypothetical protein
MIAGSRAIATARSENKFILFIRYHEELEG